MNMWHMMTCKQRSMKASTASGCIVPLRDTRQSLCRAEHWLSAWKNWAFALKYGCSSLQERWACVGERGEIDLCVEESGRDRLGHSGGVTRLGCP